MEQAESYVPDAADASAIPAQVTLPMSIGMRLCVRGLKTRLGRSAITLLGVALGTAFLMTVVGGALIESAMAGHLQADRELDRRAALLRAQIGRLGEKKLIVLARDASLEETAFVEALVDEHDAEVSVFIGGTLRVEGADRVDRIDDDAAALIGLGDYGPLIRTASVQADGPLLCVFDAAPLDGPDFAALRDAARHFSLSMHPDEIARVRQQEAEARYRTIWIVGAALLIMTVCITNAMLMSVTERVREIGTMKCLGALSSFVVKLFLIESALIGVGGAVAGAIAGTLSALAGYVYLYGWLVVLTSMDYGLMLLSGVGCVIVGIALTTLAGIYPARIASKMIPAAALTSHV